ncbi:MAG: hypothetical protein JW729_01020 [Bacteroidales bacterium]|nr:hypothetical protein [Bacteroidales bacterium]
MDTKPHSGYLCFFTRLELRSAETDDKNDWMILESNSEPGYYSKANFPINLRYPHDHHLFVVVKKPAPCFQDTVIRKSKEIIKEQKLSLHASPGQLILFISSYQCIRIRANEMDHIYPLINGLRSEGVEFLKNKKIKPYNSFVQYKKYIQLKPIYDGVFGDVETPNRYFIQVPRPVDFNEFEKIVEQVKYSCKFNHFDASLSYLNQGEHTFDFVALYSDHCDKERLQEFKGYIDQLVK